MSGKKNRPDPFSLESLLDDIEAEEQKVMEDFPDIPDSFDDDLEDDLEDDLGDVAEEPDDLDDLNDSEIQDYLDDFDDDEPESIGFTTGQLDPDDAPADSGDWGEAKTSSPGTLDSLRKMLQGGKDGNSNLMPLLIIALLVIIIVILLMQNCTCAGSKKQEDWFDTSAIEGTLPGKSPEEIQAMLNQIVDEGMFNVSIAPTIVFQNAQAEGQARIENIPANHYYMSVKIMLDDTSETIYESKGIRPGQYIEYIKLQKELPAGEYAATAFFSAYDAKDLSEQGRVAVKITIIVE